jgi:hypothetical protein
LWFRGLELEIHSSVLAPLKWLEEFMSPSFAEPGRQSRKAIRLIVDDRVYAQMQRMVPPAPQTWVDCFTKDGAFEQFAALREEQNGEVLYSTQEECFLLPERDKERIDLLARSDSWTTRRCLMRLVRELATIQALHQGDLFLHGAAVECRGGAIIVAGAKRSGKTTMLMNALRQGSARYLSNDRVFIQRTEAVLLARGMPTIVRVRPDSLAHLPGLKPPTWDYPYRYYLTRSESEQRSALLQPAYQEPPAMSPPQFCRWLGVEMATQAPLRAIVFPRIDPTVPKYSLQAMRPTDAEPLLAANCFFAGDTGPVAKAFAHGWQGATLDLERVRQAYQDLSRRCTLLSCSVGTSAFTSPNVWNAIVSAVFERG